MDSEPAIRLFSTDLDGTLFGHAAATERFATQWAEIPPAQRPLLVYNTGRSVREARFLIGARLLPEPDCIIGSVGTELQGPHSERNAAFRAELSAGWDREAVHRLVGEIRGVTPQSAAAQHPLKSSWLWPYAAREQIIDLERRIAAAGLSATIVYSSRRFLDALPVGAGKGKALQWLCQRHGIPSEQVLVAGDTANDSSMFLLPGVRGIVVGNALPEIFADIEGRAVFAAESVFADGVIEGLVHFGVLPGPATPDRNVSRLKLPAGGGASGSARPNCRPLFSAM